MKKPIVLLTMLFSLLGSFTSLAGQWQQDETGWWYQNNNGSYPSNGWQLIDSKWYYFDETGYMVANKWVGNYYLGSDGAMLINTTTPDGYYVDANGMYISNSDENDNKLNNNAFEDSLVKPIDIVGGGYELNSVYGISPFISVRNNSGKTIKYLHFEVTPFNSVKDPIYCTIRNVSTKTLTYTGPFEPDEGVCMFYHYNATWAELVYDREGEPYIKPIFNNKTIKLTEKQCAKTFSKTPSWNCAWYNSTISYLVVSKVSIEYMDGTSEVIDGLNIGLLKYIY